MKIKSTVIEVTQRDIDTGVTQSFCDCPVAKAVRRKLRVGKDKVHIQSGYVQVKGKSVDNSCLDCSVRYSYNTKKISKFINMFDKGQKVKPAKFKLEWTKF